MDKFNLLKLLKQNINTTRHSERCYARNSFGLLSYGNGLYWILRFAQNDEWVKTLGCVSGLPRKVNLARNDGYARKLGFTMAEILLSLTIIGVVAAITLPSLTGNINERTWNTQRKALYARMSQAIALMGSLNGYGLSSDSNQTISNAAKMFVTNGLSKVLKINNICDYEHLQDCGLSSKITTISNSKIDFPKTFLDNLNNTHREYVVSSYSILATYAAAFETANGESAVLYYNPNCIAENLLAEIVGDHGGEAGNTIPYLCANFVFDLNGKKGPNAVGKDIVTISAFYPTDSYVVNPVLSNAVFFGVNYYDAVDMCKSMGDDYRLPTIEEWMSLYANYRFYNLFGENGNQARYWAYTSKTPSIAWTMYPNYGIRRTFSKNTNFTARCVKR